MKTYLKFIFYLFIVILPASLQAQEVTEKKILYVDSYKATIWSSVIKQGIDSVMQKHPEIEVKTFYMDTKKNKSEILKKQAALQAKKIIDKWKPDLVITSDDNAAKYLIKPYYLNSKIPFVFCGINGDISEYGFPAKNVTGILETPLFKETYKILKKFYKCEKIAFIGCNNLTTEKAYDYITRVDNINFDKKILVSNFAELKQTCLNIQNKVDAIYFYDTYSVKNFNQEEMTEFCKKNITIPTIATAYSTIAHSLLGIPQSGEEHGKWAAQASLDILVNNISPQNIPISKSKHGKLYLNMTIAKKNGLKFPVNLIDRSALISEKNFKVLYMNLVNTNNHFYNDIEKGLLISLNIKKINSTTFDNTKSKVCLKIIKQQLADIPQKKFDNYFKTEINHYNPNVIVLINSKKIKEFLKFYNIENSPPIILCGMNLEIALPFIFNTSNEKSLFSANSVFSLAQDFAKGNRISYIGSNTPLSRNILNTLQSKFRIYFSSGTLTDSWIKLKNEFITLQKKSDIIVILDINIKKKMNNKNVYKFFLENTLIPSISFNINNKLLSLFGSGEFGFKLGCFTGQAIINMLNNPQKDASKIITIPNKKLYINKAIADNLGINIPEKVLKNSTIIR